MDRFQTQNIGGFDAHKPDTTFNTHKIKKTADRGKMLYFPSVSPVLAARYHKVNNVRVWILPHDKVSVRVKMQLYPVLSEVTRQLCPQSATENMLQTDNQKLHVLGQPPAGLCFL
jgi:hypothetical protein